MEKKTEMHWHSKIIFELRHQVGMTQQELALEAGVSSSTVYKIENGLAMGQFDTVEKIFDALNHDLEVLPRDGTEESFKRPV